MAQLTPTETHNIKEAARAHAVAVEKLGVFAQMANDEELRHLFREAQRKTSRQYEELRSYGQAGQGATAGLGIDHEGAFDMGEGARWTGAGTGAGAGAMRGGLPTAQHPEPRAAWNPPAGGAFLSDRVMITDVLETCKHLAICCTMFALECADRSLRRDFKQCAEEHIDLAYEAFKYMEQHGWYGLRSASQGQVSGISQQYRPGEANAMAPYGAGAPTGNRPVAGFARNDWETATGHGFTPSTTQASEGRSDDRTATTGRTATPRTAGTRSGDRPSLDEPRKTGKREGG